MFKAALFCQFFLWILQPKNYQNCIIIHCVSEKKQPVLFFAQHLEISTDVNEIFRQYN